MKFSTCSYSKTSVSCADYLLNSDSLGEYDFVRFQRRFINLNQIGFNYVLLDEPVYAPAGTIMNLNQQPLNKGSGQITVDLSNSSSGKPDMTLQRSAFGFRIQKLNPKSKWKFYLKAFAKKVPAGTRILALTDPTRRTYPLSFSCRF